MSETNLHLDEEKSTVLDRPSVDSAGSMLRSAREKAGLHVAALAVAIKIPVKKLEALESDQLLGMHDLVFTRALASSVCRTLKIDPAPVLAALPRTVVRELHVDSNGINAPFTPRSGGQPKSLKELITQPWLLLVLALCVGAALMAASGLWSHKDLQDSAMVSAPTAEEVAAPQVMAPVVIPAPTISEAKPDQASVTDGSAQNSEPAVSALPVSPGRGGVTTSSSIGMPGLVAQEAKPPLDMVISFKARQQSVWVKVVDAKGEVRLSRNVAAGERAECGGALPLVVVLGRADSVDVEVRGKPFDFSAFTRENVARFEVK